MPAAVTEPWRRSLPESDRQRVLASAFDDGAIGTAVLTPSGLVTLCNRAMGALVGREPAELADTTIFAVAHPEDAVQMRLAYDTLQHDDAGTVHLECRLVRRDGSILWVSVNAARPTGPTDDPPHVIMHVEDITKRKALEATLVHQALHDALTGLPNRVLFAERIEHAYAYQGRHARPNCLFYVDLNGFKSVNDHFGHAAGDRVLQLLAERIVALLRPEDTAARLGGDEFAVLCIDVEPPHCSRLAERIRAAAALPFSVDGRSIRISAAVGIVAAQTYGPAAKNALGLLQQADRHMYEQKRRPVSGGAPGWRSRASDRPDRS